MYKNYHEMWVGWIGCTIALKLYGCGFESWGMWDKFFLPNPFFLAWGRMVRKP